MTTTKQSKWASTPVVIQYVDDAGNKQQTITTRGKLATVLEVLRRCACKDIRFC